MWRNVFQMVGGRGWLLQVVVVVVKYKLKRLRPEKNIRTLVAAQNSEAIFFLSKDVLCCLFCCRFLFMSLRLLSSWSSSPSSPTTILIFVRSLGTVVTVFTSSRCHLDDGRFKSKTM